MDLPERLLPRVHSRLGMSRVVFKSYSREQLEEIVKARLGNIPLFKDEAVEFCARRVAALHGDVRRALQVCRRAAEIWEQEGKETNILLKHIKRADEELRDELHNKRIQVASWNEKLTLIAAYKVSKSVGKDIFSFEDLFFKFQQLRKTYFFQRKGSICEKRILSICRRLGRIRLFTLFKVDLADRRPKIRLALDPDEIPFILKNEMEFGPVLGISQVT
uniref:Origin recognition complex subunit 1 n=1 Tax=Aplanochytrium stocchinoi TaxID=215587 RepID=A0A7S3LM49_9STRA